MFASVSRCVASFGAGRCPCPGERVFAAFGRNEGYGACADEKQPAKDLSSIKIQKELNRPERKEGTGN